MFSRLLFTRSVRSEVLRACDLACSPARVLSTSGHVRNSASGDGKAGSASRQYTVTGVKTAKFYNLSVLETGQLVSIAGGLPHDATKVLRTDRGFVFEFGAFVLWNASLLDEANTRRAVKSAEVGTIIDESLIQQEVDALQCCVLPASQKPSNVKRTWWTDKEVVMLSDDLSAAELLEHQLAISHALALSIQLGIIEKRVDDAKVQIHALAERNEVFKWRRSRLPHQLALKVCQLRFDASEQPDLNDDGFYWDRPRLEELHLEVLKIQDYQARVRSLIKKLDFCSELMTHLVEEQRAQHSSRLEIIIICLIGFECLHEVYRIFFGARERNCGSVEDCLPASTDPPSQE